MSPLDGFDVRSAEKYSVGEEPHFVAVFLETVGSSVFAQFEGGHQLRPFVDDEQGTLFGKTPERDGQRLRRHGLPQQEAVVHEQRHGIARKTPFEADGVSLDETPFGLVFLLKTHAHVNEDYYDENYGEGQQSVAYHELLVGVQSVCHIGEVEFGSCVQR